MPMPTRLGNILRAAERRPVDKYGLDSVVCWTALWLVLPEQTEDRARPGTVHLDKALRMWLWGALFLVWTPWTWWAIPIAVIVPALAYHVGILGAATLFGDLVVAAYDLHRMSLYDSLHLPRPTSPVEERRVSGGTLVTNALWGGLDKPSIRYTTVPGGRGSAITATAAGATMPNRSGRSSLTTAPDPIRSRSAGQSAGVERLVDAAGFAALTGSARAVLWTLGATALTYRARYGQCCSRAILTGRSAGLSTRSQAWPDETRTCRAPGCNLGTLLTDRYERGADSADLTAALALSGGAARAAGRG